MKHIILSLCDFSGVWSQPYADAGHEVVRFDVARDPGEDIRLLDLRDLPEGRVAGVIAQPPCTHFAGSGARWWKSKGDEALLEGLALVDACMRIIHATQPDWWVLENPVGRLIHYLGPWEICVNPCDFAGWADDPASEAYTKKTCLWGRFNHPEPDPREPVLGSKMHMMPDSKGRARRRSQTPQGFARAFAAANPADGGAS